MKHTCPSLLVKRAYNFPAAQREAYKPRVKGPEGKPLVSAFPTGSTQVYAPHSAPKSAIHCPES